jgi:hypothetical protein
MATPQKPGKKKESTFDMALSPFTWVVREALMPDTLLRLARARNKAKKK